MKNRILAGLTIALVLVPTFAHAATAVPTDFMPADTTVSGDFTIPTSGRIHDLLAPIMKEIDDAAASIDSGDSSKALPNFLNDQAKKGKTFSLGFKAPESILMTVPVTTDEWATLATTLGTKSETYNGSDIYMVNEVAATHLGNFLVLSMSGTDIKGAIDLANSSNPKSLTNNTLYKSVSEGFLSPRLMSATINLSDVATYIRKMVDSEFSYMSDTDKQAFNTFMGLIEAFKIEGLSLSENGNTYKFTADVRGDSEKLKSMKLSLNPGGDFTPSLYTKLGDAKPMLYSETFNQKAAFDQSFALTKKLIKDLNLENESADVTMALEISQEFFSKLYSVFSEESAVAVQYNPNSIVPYVTILGNVKSNMTAAQDLAGTLATWMEDQLNSAGIPFQKTSDGRFEKFSVNFSDLGLDLGVDGPKSISLVFGVSTDGLLIFSNYPRIEQAAVRTGIASDHDFAQFVPQLKNPVSQVLYLNTRNIFDYVDTLIASMEAFMPGEAMSLADYRSYYEVMASVYGWKELFISGHGTDSSMMVNGALTVDDAQHSTFASFIDELNSKDSDADGVSDFDEMYVDHTSPYLADSDDDGVNDIDELKAGTNPHGKGNLFGDVKAGEYYTADVSMLAHQGAIGGYPDKTFKPGKNITRAEFTAIVVKAFGTKSSSGFDGLSDPFGLDPFDLTTPMSVPDVFQDVSSSAWYYDAVHTAYNNGWVSGSYNKSGDSIFRPNDTITRAEAVAILNRASTALSSDYNGCPFDSGGNSDESMRSTNIDPFVDVSSSDWFCDAVNNAYVHGLTKGKTADEFAPNDAINRADAAIMIKRALEQDVEQELK